MAAPDGHSEANRREMAALRARIAELEDALARSEVVMAAISDGLLIADADGNILKMNPAGLRFHRWESESRALRNMRDFPEFMVESLDGSPVPLENWPLSRVLRGETITELECRVTSTDSGKSWLASYSGTPIRNKAGEVAFAILTFRDISEKKLQEEQLRNSRQSLEVAQKLGRCGTFEWRPEENVNIWSEELLELYGFRPGEFRSTYEDWFECVLPEDREAAAAAIEESLTTGEYVSEFRTRRRETGEIRWMQGRGQVIFDEVGKARRMLGLYMDITERKAMEKDLIEKQKLESIGLLAGGIAHDFNNLLAGIMGYTSLAKDLLPPSGQPAEFLQEIMRISEQAAHLTRQMLAYAGKGRTIIEPVSLSEVARDMKGLLHPFVSGKTNLYLDVEPDLPVIDADRSQIQQLFMNLVVNAAESIGEQPGMIVIRTGVQDVDEHYIRTELDDAGIAPGRYVWLQVSDSGVGIDDRTKAKIFEPFFTTKYLGRGLGLAAVAGIVRTHKGAVKVSSTPSKGSSFLVLFPAVVSGQSAPKPQLETTEDLAGTATILVVDDEEVVRHTARLSLERLGYRVLEASDGFEAVEIFRSERDNIALVILDFSMPGMSGPDTLPELQKIRPDVEVLISSGYLESETVPLFVGLQIAGFIQKPYTSTSLAKKVKDTLARHAQ